MKKLCFSLVACLLFIGDIRADISMPQDDTFYDKMGRGLANIAWAPAEILESQWILTQREGGTVGFTKGMLVQGPSRMFMDMGLGIFDVLTAPFPLSPGPSYETMKRAPYDSMVIQEYPPADLENWY